MVKYEWAGSIGKPRETLVISHKNVIANSEFPSSSSRAIGHTRARRVPPSIVLSYRFDRRCFIDETSTDLLIHWFSCFELGIASLTSTVSSRLNKKDRTRILPCSAGCGPLTRGFGWQMDVFLEFHSCCGLSGGAYHRCTYAAPFSHFSKVLT